MRVDEIRYSSRYVERLRELPEWIIAVTIKKEKLFKDNPLHPSLRMHALTGKLKGFWSISITSHYRIIFERLEDGRVVFVSIGNHDIYRSL